MAKTTQSEYREYGRIRRYGVVGFFLLVGIVIGAILATYQVAMPNLVPLITAVRVLGFFVLFLTIGVFFVLFTLRGTLRLVRQQATEVAVLRASSHVHPLPPPAPAPAVEYVKAPPAVPHEPAPTPAKPPPVEYIKATPLAPASSRSVLIVEGIGPTYSRRLHRAGVATLRALRSAPTSLVARSAVVPPTTAEHWKEMAALMVVPHVSAQDAEVLVAAGVRSPRQLAHESPDTLFARCQRANHAHENRLFRGEVERAVVVSWVADARRHLDFKQARGRTNGARPTAATFG